MSSNVTKLELEEWAAYKVTHGKTYGVEEDKERLAIFLKTKEKIAAHNSRYDQGLETYTMGLNQFADMEHAEFTKNHTGVRVPEN